MNTMKLSDSDVLSPEKRREIALLQLLVHEHQRLWTIGEDDTVQLLGHAFHNVNRLLRMPHEPGRDASMIHFRMISADRDELSRVTGNARRLLPSCGS